MTDEADRVARGLTGAEIVEQHRRDVLIEGCKRIEPKLGEAVEAAFNAGYTADQVHAVLSAGNVLSVGPLGLVRDKLKGMEDE